MKDIPNNKRKLPKASKGSSHSINSPAHKMNGTWLLDCRAWQIALDPRKAFQRFIELHRATRGSVLVNTDVGLRWNIGYIGLAMTPQGRQVTLQITYMGAPNPLAVRGMEAMGHLAYENQLFPDPSILWTLNDMRAREFRAFVARAINAGELDDIKIPTSLRSKMHAMQRSLESKRLADYCPLNCDLCGLTGFRGSFQMAEHLGSSIHKEKVSLLKRALQRLSQSNGCLGREERQELMTLQVRNKQVWPRADGALFEVYHSELLDEASQDHAPELVDVWSIKRAKLWGHGLL